ncbi:MAG: phosphotransferase [Anaerolineales bacterium]
MTDENLREKIHLIMPDLEIEHLEHNREGLINDVVIINHELVFRFAKNDGFAQILNLELDILDLVRSHIDLPVPSPVYRGPGSTVYPKLHGQALLRQNVLEMEDSTREHIAHQLGTFLSHLHATPIDDLDWEIPTTLAPVTWRKWVEIRGRVEEKVYPLLLRHQVTWAEQFFDRALEDHRNFTYEPTLIHADLAPYHILYDADQGEISGIIDFGVAGIGDPALDLGTLITHYGESFVSMFRETYPGMDALLPRARFYAQAIEFQWVLLGLETGDKFWFTAHLGGARDIFG